MSITATAPSTHNPSISPLVPTQDKITPLALTHLDYLKAFFYLLAGCALGGLAAYNVLLFPAFSEMISSALSFLTFGEYNLVVSIYSAVFFSGFFNAFFPLLTSQGIFRSFLQQIREVLITQLQPTHKEDLLSPVIKNYLFTLGAVGFFCFSFSFSMCAFPFLFKVFTHPLSGFGLRYLTFITLLFNLPLGYELLTQFYHLLTQGYNYTFLHAISLGAGENTASLDLVHPYWNPNSKISYPLDIAKHVPEDSFCLDFMDSLEKHRLEELFLRLAPHLDDSNIKIWLSRFPFLIDNAKIFMKLLEKIFSKRDFSMEELLSKLPHILEKEAHLNCLLAHPKIGPTLKRNVEGYLRTTTQRTACYRAHLTLLDRLTGKGVNFQASTVNPLESHIYGLLIEKNGDFLLNYLHQKHLIPDNLTTWDEAKAWIEEKMQGCKRAVSKIQTFLGTVNIDTACPSIPDQGKKRLKETQDWCLNNPIGNWSNSFKERNQNYANLLVLLVQLASNASPSIPDYESDLKLLGEVLPLYNNLSFLFYGANRSFTKPPYEPIGDLLQIRNDPKTSLTSHIETLSESCFNALCTLDHLMPLIRLDASLLQTAEQAAEDMTTALDENHRYGLANPVIDQTYCVILRQDDAKEAAEALGLSNSDNPLLTIYSYLASLGLRRRGDFLREGFSPEELFLTPGERIKTFALKVAAIEKKRMQQRSPKALLSYFYGDTVLPPPQKSPLSQVVIKENSNYGFPVATEIAQFVFNMLYNTIDVSILGIQTLFLFSFKGFVGYVAADSLATLSSSIRKIIPLIYDRTSFLFTPFLLKPQYCNTILERVQLLAFKWITLVAYFYLRVLGLYMIGINCWGHFQKSYSPVE